MKFTLKSPAMMAVMTAMTAIVFSASGHAHAILQTATPKAGEILSKAPLQIVLHFNEPLEAPFSKITLRDGKGVVVKTDKATVAKAHPDILQLITPKLAAGSYQVLWSTMTLDGHRAKGQYNFSVK